VKSQRTLSRYDIRFDLFELKWPKGNEGGTANKLALIYRDGFYFFCTKTYINFDDEVSRLKILYNILLTFCVYHI